MLILLQKLQGKLQYLSINFSCRKKLLSHLNTHCVSFWQFECSDVMAELPSGLLEACVVVGAHSDKLRDIHQVCMQTDSQSKDG